MLVRKIFAYFIGFLYIRVEGFYIERFINSCIHKGIYLWNIKRDKSTIIYTRISINDFKRIREIAKTTKCKIKIVNKRGVPILVKKYRKRKIFFFTILLVLAIIISVTRYIWNIEINGLQTIDRESFLQTLKECGLDVGKSIGQVNTTEIINNIRLKRDDIAWIGITIKGTNAIVEVAETTKKPDIVKEDEFCDIVADKDGIITKISVQNGTKAVDVGTEVKKGDILAYGYMEGKYTGQRFVHARADIQAKIEYIEEEVVDFNQTIYTPTGKEEKKYSINFNNFKINLFKRFSNFENYDTIVENKKISLFSNLYLPIEINCYTNHEISKEEKVFTLQELKENAVEKLKQRMEERIDNLENVVDKNVITEPLDDSVKVKLVYTVLENIGLESKIVF